MPLSNGAENTKSQEDLDNLWEIWTDMILGVIRRKKPKSKSGIEINHVNAIKRKKSLYGVNLKEVTIPDKDDFKYF
jgi:hypothetical protein